MAFDSKQDNNVAETDEWAIRAEYWASKSRAAEPKRLKRSRRANPLILSGHNISLRIENGTLVMRGGKSRLPRKKRDEYRFFRGSLDLPPRIILIDGSGSLSLAVLDWLREQKLPLIRVRWDGKSASTFADNGMPTDPLKVKWQIEQANDERARVKFSVNLIRKKLIASRQTLRKLLKEQRAFEKADQVLSENIQLLKSNPPTSIDKLYAVEGPCAYFYFRAWEGLSLKWKGLDRHPLPPTWERFEQRSSVLTGKKPKNWRATHPINAMLNYAYAVLEADVRLKILAEGYDPRFGIMHRVYKDASDAYVFDLMEPLRPKVDAAVLEFALGDTFSPKDFVLRNDGVCRLSPTVTKRLVQQLNVSKYCFARP
ncbi:CRISPR-associated endonuclease Cas1 [Henriciella marina]|uniref:CRISPR-associated endonuclease Cas1 n=1 Tax=Henriciella marina TaxID=453851 RepID=UPI0012EA7335|nr:CRISPR-associated endonuclease Cas1 [Henriciella marina]